MKTMHGTINFDVSDKSLNLDNATLLINSKDLNLKGDYTTVAVYDVRQDQDSSISFLVQRTASTNSAIFRIDYTGTGKPDLNIFAGSDSSLSRTITYSYDSETNITSISTTNGTGNKYTVTFEYVGNIFDLTPDQDASVTLAAGTGFSPGNISSHTTTPDLVPDIFDYTLPDGGSLFLDYNTFPKGRTSGVETDYYIDSQGDSTINFTSGTVFKNYGVYNFHIREHGFGNTTLNIMHDGGSTRSVTYSYDASTGQTIVSMALGAAAPRGSWVNFIYDGNVFQLREGIAYTQPMPVDDGFSFVTGMPLVMTHDTINFDVSDKSLNLDNATLLINSKDLNLKGDYTTVAVYDVRQDQDSSISFLVQRTASTNSAIFRIDYTGTGKPDLNIFAGSDSSLSRTITYSYDSETNITSISTTNGTGNKYTVTFEYVGNIFDLTPDQDASVTLAAGTGFSPGNISSHTTTPDLVPDIFDYTLPDGGSLFLDYNTFPKGRTSGVETDYYIDSQGDSTINFTSGTVFKNYGVYNFHIREHGFGNTTLNIMHDGGSTRSVTYSYDASTGQTIVSMALGAAAPRGSWVNFIYDGNVFNLSPGTVQTQTLYVGQGFSFRSDVSCYLAGTLIATPEGERAVEFLRPGDAVIVLREGRKVVETLRWVGMGQAVVRPNLPNDEAGYPVCIKADALGEGQPYRDLHVTSEHCLFLHDRFIPVRMLVNNISIFYEFDQTSFSFYHVELERHGILLANGVLSESYLDSGNRGSFRQYTCGGQDVVELTRSLSWQSDAAAPLDASPRFVEPIYRSVAERAGVAPVTPDLTCEPDLRLTLPDGRRIDATNREGNCYSFAIPAGVGEIWIESQSARPCDLWGPFHDDRRRFGVKVGEVMVLDTMGRKRLSAHLRVKSLAGWHALEDGAPTARWTSGKALFPVSDDRGTNHARMLVITLTEAGPYLRTASEPCDLSLIA